MNNPPRLRNSDPIVLTRCTALVATYLLPLMIVIILRMSGTVNSSFGVQDIYVMQIYDKYIDLSCSQFACVGPVD